MTKNNKESLLKEMLFSIKFSISTKPCLAIFIIILNLVLAVLYGLNVYFFAKSVIMFFAIYLASQLIIAFIELILNYMVKKIKVMAANDLDLKIANKLNKMPFANLISNKNFRDNQLAHGGIRAITYSFQAWLEVFASIIKLLFTAIVVFSFNVWIGVAIVISFVPMLLINSVIEKKNFSFDMQNIDLEREKNSYEKVLISNEGIADSRNFNSKNIFLSKWKVANKNINENFLKINLNQEISLNLMSIIEFFVFVLILCLSIFFAVNGTLAIGQFVAITASIKLMQNDIAEIADKIGYLYSQILKSKFVRLFLNEEEEKNGTIKLEEFQSFKLENVSFSYSQQEGSNTPVKKVLDSLNFEVHKGERIAIVGENGSGKTTLISILLGLLKASDGKFMINGIEMCDVEKSSFRKLLSVVSQSSERYFLTLRENVALGEISKIDQTEQIEECLDKSHFDKGEQRALDNQLGRIFEGLEFSGGQWQKIAISRSFFKDSAKIFVFDEPTSAIDAIVEEKILNQFIKETKDKTAIIISHRLSLCKKVDKIAFMENGKIVEFGTHEELLAKKGKYAKMFLSQQKWY
ncbi:MAG: ABC transporter ATP-binding protein [Clostridia bacterium]